MSEAEAKVSHGYTFNVQPDKNFTPHEYFHSCTHNIFIHHYHIIIRGLVMRLNKTNVHSLACGDPPDVILFKLFGLTAT